MTVNDVAFICSLTVDLTRLRQIECKHLCIENFAPELFGKLVREFLAAERDTFQPLASVQATANPRDEQSRKPSVQDSSLSTRREHSQFMNRESDNG